MNSYPEIEKHFGTPLSQVPKPNVPFRWKPWHGVVIVGVASAAIYGIYCVCKDIKAAFRKDEEPEPKFTFKTSSPEGEKSSKKK